MDSDFDDGIEATQGLPIASPANMLPVQVIFRETVAPDAVTFHIVLPGTEQAPAPYLPGQFVTLALPTPRETLYRSYSLCGDGNPDKPWEITVKKMHMGAVSTFFYNLVREGSLLYASLPRGTFTLPRRLSADMALAFVAAGSGITPLFGMLRAIAALPPQDRPMVQLHYASKSPDMMIYYDQLREIDPNETWLSQYYYFSSRRARLTAEGILECTGRMTPYAHWYMCGPELLKRELIDRLEEVGVPPERIHTEVFAIQQTPAYHLANMPSNGSQIRIAATNATIDAEPQETILAALERNGYRPSFNCRIGVCGSCKLRVTRGNAVPAGDILSRSEREQGYVLSCIAVPTGDITLESGGSAPSGVAGAGGSSRGETKVLARLTAIMAISGILLGAWNLTDHKPLSWEVQAAPPASNSNNSPSGPNTTGGGGNSGATPGTTPNTPQAGTTPRPGAPTSTPAPTATPLPPGAPTPTPTVAPPPTATPRPVPTPKATSTPSK